MHSISRVCAHLSTVYVTYAADKCAQMRETERILRISTVVARATQNSCRENICLDRIETIERTRRRDSLTHSARRTRVTWIDRARFCVRSGGGKLWCPVLKSLRSVATGNSVSGLKLHHCRQVDPRARRRYPVCRLVFLK